MYVLTSDLAFDTMQYNKLFDSKSIIKNEKQQSNLMQLKSILGPSLNQKMTEDMAIHFLAELLVDEFYERTKNEELSRQSKIKASCDILPGIDKRAG